MSDPFLGQITQIAFTFAPQDYAYCDGQSLPIQQNAALASLLGNQFGGDLSTYFKLPDLRGRVPVHPDPGTAIATQGVVYGSETVTLTTSQIPSHTHQLAATTSNGQSPFSAPAATKVLANAVQFQSLVPHSIYGQPTNMTQLNPNTTTTTGGQPHPNIQPSLVIGFIIALVGTYPYRN